MNKGLNVMARETADNLIYQLKLELTMEERDLLIDTLIDLVDDYVDSHYG